MVDRELFAIGKKKTSNRNQIGSLAEYLAYVGYLATLSEGDLWFRGLSQARYDLIPGIYREAGAWEYSPSSANQLFNDFIMKAKGSVGVKDCTKWEWLQLMQHYGLPTRLLDWTEGALIGLYFAVRGRDPISVPSVWVLDPFWLNQMSAGSNVVFTTDALIQTKGDDIANIYVSDHDELPAPPVAVIPSYFTERISAQKGHFTVHGSDRSGMTAAHQRQPEGLHLVQLKISTQAAADIKADLSRAGITETSIFPDLEGLARELKDEWGFLPLN